MEQNSPNFAGWGTRTSTPAAVWTPYEVLKGSDLLCRWEHINIELSKTEKTAFQVRQRAVL